MTEKHNHISRFLFGLLSVFLIGIIFSGCEAEKDFTKGSDSGRQMRREITFEQFKREIGQPNFNTRISIATSSTGRNMDDFDIDSTKVKALETNYLVYSMKLDPKFVPEEGKFYNLFVYKDNDNEIVKQIMEILPTTTITGNTEQELNTFLQTATKELIYSSKMMNSSAICINSELVDVCYCYGHRWYECNGCDFGFHLITIFTYGACPNTGGGEGGGITADPVLPTVNKDNCGDLKTKSLNQEFKNKMDELKGDAISTLEKGFHMFSGTPKFSSKYTATIADQSGIQMPPNTRLDYVGSAHCHLSYTILPTAQNFAIFTPSDFIGFIKDINFPDPPVSSLTLYMTCFNDGKYYTYAIKIKDMDAYVGMCVKLVEDKDKFDNIWKNDIKVNNPPAKQVNEFLKAMKNDGFDNAIELYKCDDNYQNWEQLILDADNNTKRIKC